MLAKIKEKLSHNELKENEELSLESQSDLTEEGIFNRTLNIYKKDNLKHLIKKCFGNVINTNYIKNYNQSNTISILRRNTLSKIKKEESNNSECILKYNIYKNFNLRIDEFTDAINCKNFEQRSYSIDKISDNINEFNNKSNFYNDIYKEDNNTNNDINNKYYNNLFYDNNYWKPSCNSYCNEIMSDDIEQIINNINLN